MTGLIPRDMQQWMRTVERGLRQSGNAAGSIAASVAATQIADYASAANADRNRVPAAPITLTSQTYITLGANKRFQAGVIVDFPDVTIDSTGSPMAIEQYELWGRTGTDDYALLSTATVSALQWSGATPGSVWNFKARAIGSLAIKPGLFSTVLTVTMTNDTTAPGQPSTPTIGASGKAITLRWDGKVAGGADMPLDLDYVIVASGTTSSPTTEIDRFLPGGPQILVDPQTNYNTTKFYRLRAVDTSGNLSPWSAQVSAYGTPLVDADVIISAIDAATTTITNIGTAALVNGAVTAGKIANQAVDQTKLATAINDAIAQGVSAYGSIPTINNNISTLTTSVNGKNTITNSVSSASGSGVTTGDRWQKWTTLGVGGKLTATWRWNGSAWIQELLDPVYIPQIDIGAGTFGALDGGRLTANSVIAGALTVTDLTNFAPSFAESPNDWALSGGMTIGMTSLDPSGWRLNAFENTAAAYAYGPYKAVTPGETLYATATSYRAGGGTNGTYLRYYWYDSAKVLLTPNFTGSAQASTLPTGTKYELTTAVPAGAAYARLVLPIGSAGAGSGINTGYYNVAGRRQVGSVYIADGAVTADKVVANSIGAKQILIGDFTNLATGSDFEDATAVPWTLDPQHVISTTTKKFGTSSLQLTASAALDKSIFKGDLRVKEGEKWLFKFWAYIDSAFNGTTNSTLRIGDQNNTWLGAIPFNAISRSTWGTAPLMGTVTVPAGVTSLRVELWSDNTAGVAFIDDIQIRRMSEASLIQNLGVEQLTASAASIDSAVITKLWTDVVNSRKITTDMLVVSGENLIPDPYFFDADQNTYRLTTGGTNYLGTDSATTAKILQFRDHTSTGGTVRLHTVETRIKTIPGEEYNLALDYRYRGTNVGGANPGTIKFTLYCDAPDGSFLRSVTLPTTTVAASNGTSWQKMSEKYVIGADVGFIRVAVTITNEISTGDVEMRFPRVKRKMSADLVVDGSILTRHLTVTEDMTVALLNVHKVKALEIDANDIVADTGTIGVLRGGILINDAVTTGVLKADAITSKHTLTGATIQTLSTANRGIKITGGNFYAYDGGGNATLTITGSTGAIDGTGKWKTGSSGNYIEMTADSGGGLLRFWTGTGTGRGNIYARDDAGGKRMTLTYSDLDAPSYTVPLIALWDDKVNLSYGSKRIQVGKNPTSGSEELVLDATGADVLVKGGLELSDSSARVRWRYSSSNFTLGYIGQRPETNSGVADFEVRAAANGVRLSGTELIANPIYTNTSSSAANVYVDSNGKVWRSTSASKYKADQQVLTVPDTLLDIEMKDWVDKNQQALFEELNPLPRPFMQDEQSRFDAINLTREPGVIAEDVVAAGGEQFTVYGPDGQIEGVKYERLALAQIQVLIRRLKEAEDRLAILEGV